MNKTLSERIAQLATIKKPMSKDKNRADFLIMRSDIKQALVDGWPVKTIWATLIEEAYITFSYQAFRGYVKRLIQEPTMFPSKSGASHQMTNKTMTDKKQHVLAGFTFNASPKKEDLL